MWTTRKCIQESFKRINLPFLALLRLKLRHGIDTLERWYVLSAKRQIQKKTWVPKKKSTNKGEFERMNENKTTKITSPTQLNSIQFEALRLRSAPLASRPVMTLPNAAKAMHINISKKQTKHSTRSKFPSAGFAPCPAGRMDPVGVKSTLGILLRGVQFCKVRILKVRY